MLNNIEVRSARIEDKDAVVAFCQHTFSWGDYIGEVFDDWVNNVKGVLLVALIDQHPVGILHELFLGNGVTWLEGMRVHPDYRRQKIGTQLDSAARQAAREHGLRLARLVTSMKNIPAQKTLATEGYHRVAQFNEWETEPAPEDFSFLRRATENDIPEILALWGDSEIRQASQGVIPDRHWHWREIDAAYLREQIAADQVRVCSGGFVIVAALEERDWNGLTIYALVADDETASRIARAVRGEATYRGYAHVEATIADCALLNTAFQHADYRTDGGLFLYEQAL